MELLRLIPYTGPQHYVFVDPDNGRTYRAPDKQALARQIVAYRSANGLLPIKHLDIVLEHYWASLPENRHNAEKAPPLKRGLLAYLKGGIALIDNIWLGARNRVSQQQADFRAEQCAKCKFNQFPDKGPFVAWSDMIAENSVGDAKTKHHDVLGNCLVCTCCLKAKVWVKGKILLSEEERAKMLSVNCWQVQEKKNG